MPAAGETLQGRAEVVDGDGLRLDGGTVRLFGIDAPELDQSCIRGGTEWPCGCWARDELRSLTAARDVVCEGRTRDRYGRLVATCHAGGPDLGEELVRRGAAFAYRKYALDYVAAEKEAAIAGRGVWAGEAEAPAEFRAASRAAPAAEAPGGCAIKGNISSSGRIFHVPGQADYARTRIDPAKGERWFCTEAEARAAGWRGARR